jgi:hypothetical protein
MIEYAPKELAAVLWEQNFPDRGTLAAQATTTQGVYERAASAAIEWFIDKTLEREGSAVEVAADLAGQLAFKLNHPTWFADGVRESLDRYVELVGEENLGDEIRKAREI